jgi:hypothetical protein
MLYFLLKNTGHFKFRTSSAKKKRRLAEVKL